MGNDWSERKEGQPFFAQATFDGTADQAYFLRDTINPVEMAAVNVPPYYPDVPLTRRVIANGMEGVQNVDIQKRAIENHR